MAVQLVLFFDNEAPRGGREFVVLDTDFMSEDELADEYAAEVVDMVEVDGVTSSWPLNQELEVRKR